MSCLTLTFLLYSFLPQLRDLTGKFILGICSFLTTNYALRLIDVEMFGFKVRQNSVCVVYRAVNLRESFIRGGLQTKLFCTLSDIFTANGPNSLLSSNFKP